MTLLNRLKLGSKNFEMTSFICEFDVSVFYQGFERQCWLRFELLNIRFNIGMRVDVLNL